MAVIEAILGSVLGVMKWIGGLIAKTRSVSKAQVREHDVALFRKADATVNEPFLNDLLNSHLYNHWCDKPDIVAVGHFCTDYQREEHQFLDRRVRVAALEAIRTLRAVRSFVGTNFFTSDLPDDSDRLFLNRTLRESPDEAQRDHYYKVLVPELNRLIEEAWESYKSYRARVKRRLMV